MNCFSGSIIGRPVVAEVPARGRSPGLLLWCLMTLVVWATSSAAAEPPIDSLIYDIEYSVRPDPSTRELLVTFELRQSKALLREVSMPVDSRITGLQADGNLHIDADLARWRPPATGGAMSWKIKVDHQRNGAGFDAWLGPAWGLLRAEDIIPRAATRTLRGAHSRTRLSFDLPAGWSVVTQYYGKDYQFLVANHERRFDQPSGWIVMGKIGVRRETIAGMRIAVAAPIGESVRRMDILAMLHWTLPELARLLPELPARLTIVSAGEPMWRGGLSAPQSLFIHAERPLISENGTSTLLHEIMHLALGIKVEPGFDWIVEGLAEYYSLELLMRSGTISGSRYTTAKSAQAEWARSATSLCQRTSSGSTSALAVTIFTALDAEIRERTGGSASLDDLVRDLSAGKQPVSLVILSHLAERLMSHKPDALHIDKLPGCRNIAGGP